jgi:hypothetical protein
LGCVFNAGAIGPVMGKIQVAMQIVGGNAFEQRRRLRRLVACA